MSSVGILIVDDHAAVRAGLKQLISSRPGWLVCGEAADGEEAISQALHLKPSVIVMDISMPRMDGLEATRRIREELPDTEVLIVSQHDSQQVVSEAQRAGARGFVLKSHLSADLLPALESALLHSSRISAPVTKAWQDAIATASKPRSADRAPGDPGPHDDLDLMSGGGDMGALMRSHDWSHTPFGPVSQWPQSLRTALRICLDSRFPIVIWWGPELRLLYNDAWRPALGTTKHPHALGAPGKEVWADVWDTIGPMLESVMRTGKATWENDQLLLFDRYGYVEETYWTYSYSSIRLASGEVGGVFSAVHEVTDRVLSARRMKTLREVADQVVQAKNEIDACTLAMQSIVRNPADCPYAIIFLCDGKNVRRVAASFDPSASFPSIIDLARADRWGVQQAALSKAAQIINLDTPHIVPAAPFGAKCQQAISIPILSPTREAIAVITIGISPYRALDSSYREFLESLARNLAANINNAKAYDEERKRAEALAELDRAKTVFFSNVSHEFRTPLTLMLGPLEDSLAARDELSAQHRERLEVAHRNSVRLLRLVNTLLDFSRIEAGRIQAAYEPTDLSRLTSELASLFRSATDRAGLKLLINCPAFEEAVYVDREMWEKIVFNLLSNAFKFTFSGEIEISLQRVDGLVELAVRDTGTGIPEQEIPHLFERFYRVKNAHGRTFEGSGIGLALVQELAKLHGGGVRVESHLNQGSTFTVSIPLGDAHLPADRISAKRTLESTGLRGEAYVQEALRWLPEGQNERDESSVAALLSSAEAIPDSSEKPVGPALILLADDNADMREYVQRLLKGRYEVIAVPDGELALQHARERRPDLILSDIMMPRLDGFGLLQTVRADETLRHIPVILLSARAGEESRVEGLHLGADDYLVKPFSARELLARVTSQLNMSRIRRESAEIERKLRADAEFERSRLRDLLLQAPAAICLLTGPDHRYAFANQEYLKLTGRKRPEDFLGKTVRKALPEFEGQPFFDLLDEVYHTGTPHRGTEVKVLLNRNSERPEERYHNFAYLPVAGLTSGMEGVLVHVVDVTSEVLARQEIEKRERHFREMIDALPAAIYTTDAQGRLAHFNPAAVEFSGRTPELGTDQWCVNWKLYYPDGRPMPHDECPMAIALKEGRVIKGAEAIAERPDGTRRWFTPFPTPLRDDHGKIVGGINMLLDITDRKQAEHEIRRSESQLRGAFGQTYSFLVLLEPDGTIIEANRAALEAAGATAEQVVGQKFWEPWWSPLPDEVARLKGIVAKVANGHSVRDECYFCLPDGSRRVGDRTLSPVLDDHGKVTMIVATGLDITERKESEVASAVGARHHKALFHLADELHRAGSMEEVYNAALNAILDGLQCNRASILLCDEAGVMRFTSWRGLSNKYRAAVEGHSAWRPDEPNPQPVCISDIETADLGGALKNTVKREGISALAFIPLVSHGKLIGKFVAYFNSPHEFGDAEIQVGLTIARQLTFAIERTRDDEALSKSQHQLAREAEALKELNELSSRLWQIRDLHEGLEEMLSATIELVGADKGNVQLLNERKILTITAQRGFQQPFFDFFREVSTNDDTACGRALRTGERIVIEDIEQDAPFAPFREVSRAAGYSAVISNPLIGKGGTPLGILSTHFQHVHRPTDQELRRLDLYVRQASAFIDRCKADEVLRQNEQLYKTITDASPIMVWMSGTDKLCYYFNKGWLDFVGRTLEQEYGNGWAENVHAEDFDRCLQVYVSSFDARRPFEMEYRLRHHSGQYRWILDRAVPRYTPDGTFEGYVGGCLDIHDQKEAADKMRRADEAVHLMNVQDQERRHIARELHDTAGQTLTVLGLSLAQLAEKLGRQAPDLLKNEQQAEELVRQLHQEIRTTSYLLHPPLLDENGLPSALKWYAQGLMDRGALEVSVDISDSFGRLPADMELAIFRIVQECLTNVHRHSGAKTANIHVARKTDTIEVEVRDQGKGIPPARLEEIRLRGSGVGLRGIRERLTQFHGEIKIESNGSGTTVLACIPIATKLSTPDLRLAAEKSVAEIALAQEAITAHKRSQTVPARSNPTF